MKELILLVVAMPCMVFGQNVEKSTAAEPRFLIRETKDEPGNPGPGPGDVIITEIMADPLPPVTLPSKEYVEIHNRSGSQYNLTGWQLSDGTSKCNLNDVTIYPGDFIIVCQHQDSAFFSGYGKTMGVKSFPTLTDKGKMLFLTDPDRNLVHGVEYSSEWYGDALKDDGGWSLEMIDTEYPFYQKGNWKASVSPEGGTPGKKNSVAGFNPDTRFKGFENVFPEEPGMIRINFEESVFFNAGLGEYLVLQGNGIASIDPVDPLLRAFLVKTVYPLEPGRIYRISAGRGITDFAGNVMERDEFYFGLPGTLSTGDILFNELLFNPLPGEPDYIELYNVSPRVINLAELFLVSVSAETGDTSSAVPVSEVNRCIKPGDYHVLTTDREALINRFPASVPDNIFRTRSLPSMPDKKGHIILFSRQLEKIDEVRYTEKMHFPLLSGKEGVSLEKIAPEMASTIAENWYSASEPAGWGTPGAPNSILLENMKDEDLISFSSTRITPDNDGFEDYLVIKINPGGLGNVISINIYDESGMFVKKLTDNLLAGPEALIVWDGTATGEKLAETGIYILFIKLFNDRGKTRSWKKVCTVIR